MPRALLNVTALLVFAATLLFTHRAEATHFRYGSVRYTVPDPAQPATVQFDVFTAWRSDFIGTTTLVFGDGQQDADTTGAVIGTGYDANGLAYTITHYAVSHAYGSLGQYEAFFLSGSRLSTLVNSADSSFRVATKVDLAAGNTASPVAEVPPVFTLQTGGIRTFTLKAVDSDGGPVTCRFATTAESGLTTTPPVVPGSGAAPTITQAADGRGCTVSWDLGSATNGQQYAMQIVLESTNPNNGLKNSAALDFMIVTTAAPPPTCQGTGWFTVDMGSSFSQGVTGTSLYGPNLLLSVIGLPAPWTPASGTASASPFAATLNWTPGAADQGAHATIAVFMDSQYKSSFCALALEVPPCPVFGSPCSAGVGGCESSGTLACVGNNVTCSAVAGLPQPEACDGIDNNCDGAIDEGNPGAGLACSTGLPGVCDPGLTSCNGGATACVPTVAPGSQQETCSGLDDDCDGEVDEGFDVGAPCGVGVGACAATGVVVCAADGMAACDAQPATASPEICGNGIDEDCDGEADNGCDPGSGGMGGAASGGGTAAGGGTGTSASAGGGGPGGGDAEGGCSCTVGATKEPVDLRLAGLALACAALMARRRQSARSATAARRTR